MLHGMYVPEKIREEKLPLSVKLWRSIQEGEKIPVYDTEEPVVRLGELSLESIEKGTQLMKEQFPEDYNDVIHESWDAYTADLWMQLCVIGEVIYG